MALFVIAVRLCQLTHQLLLQPTDLAPRVDPQGGDGRGHRQHRQDTRADAVSTPPGHTFPNGLPCDRARIGRCLLCRLRSRLAVSWVHSEKMTTREAREEGVYLRSRACRPYLVRKENHARNPL